MRLFIILWGLILFSNKVVAQEHLAKTLSITPAMPLNGKGFSLTLHYHLNSFDEFRGGFLLYEYRHSDTLRIATNLFHFDFAKGFKFKQQSLDKFGYYFGIGIFTGEERPIRNDGAVRIPRTTFGIRPFMELEWAILRQLTLMSSIGHTITFSQKADNRLIAALGTRLYF